MIKSGFVFRLILVMWISAPGQAVALDVEEYPALVELVDIMTEEDGYPRDQLLRVLSGATVDQKTIDLMNKQYEALPWYRYRKIFINQDRIDRGVEFWKVNKPILDAAEQEYGVPPAVIVALIGVETHYGTRMGDRRVLDSLVTLTADFPRRSKFFSAELRTFLNTTREENIPPESVFGSYAGAIGIPQFMPTSYRAYSVDFNGNGRRDLVNEMEDAIGSVANYLSVHGWTSGQGIFATVDSDLTEQARSQLSKRAKPKIYTQELLAMNVDFDARDASKKVALLSLTQEQGKSYFVGFRNFYAITRYNPSVNYAMAVTELSLQIKARYQQQI